MEGHNFEFDLSKGQDGIEVAVLYSLNFNVNTEWKMALFRGNLE